MQRQLQLLLLVAAATPAQCFWNRIWKDWVALNARSTTRHIMRPCSEEGKAECLTLKQELRSTASSGTFVVDAFAAAAAVHSLDEESRDDGGIIGVRLKQGVCREPELDRACFCSPLGQIAGPIQTDVGWHLVLVEERIGLERYDSGMNRIVPQPLEAGGVKSVLAPSDPEEANELLSRSALASLAIFLVSTTVGSNVIAQLASSVDVEQIANSVS